MKKDIEDLGKNKEETYVSYTPWDQHIRLARNGQPNLPIIAHFNSPSTNSPSYVSILSLLQCRSDSERKFEEQHLIFCLGTLQPG
eukprot:g15937.t1